MIHHRLRLTLVRGLTLLLLTLWATSLQAAGPMEKLPLAKSSGSPAEEISRTLSQVTGIAISPLLGTAGLGAWNYINAKSGTRALLPWYSQPWFWGSGLFLVGLCALKDTSGVVLPASLKKPFDIAELFENKLSALVATGAIVPLALQTFATLHPSTSSGLTAHDSHWAAMDLSWLGNALAAPVCLVVFGAVWLVNHTIQVLILISPFGALDALLKSARTALLGSVVGTHWLSPHVGAVWAAIIAFICRLLSGWAFRLTVLGAVFGWDLITFRSRRFHPERDPLMAFSAHRVGKAPRRSYGRISRNPDGHLQFTWRAWLISQPKAEVLISEKLSVGDGLLHNDLRRSEPGGDEVLFNLPPRCNGHEEAIAAFHRFEGVQPAGAKAMLAWLGFHFGHSKATASEQP